MEKELAFIHERLTMIERALAKLTPAFKPYTREELQTLWELTRRGYEGLVKESDNKCECCNKE